MTASRASLAHRGETFEALLTLVHGGYQRAGHFVVRQGAVMRPIKTPTGRAWVPVEKAPADYLVVASGWSWQVEAKSCRDGRWRFNLLEEHQALSLDAWERQGPQHRAGLLVALGGRVDVSWWLPWGAVGPRWWRWWRTPGRAANGEASLDAVDCRLLGAEVVGGDWLPVAGAMAMRGAA